MSLGTENGLSVADIAAVTDRKNGNCGGWGMGGGFGEMLIAMVMLFLFPMMFGGGMWGGGFGGFGGGWGNGGLLAAANGTLTRADLCSEFNFNGLENAVRGVTQGLCDGFYAMQNSINGLGMNVMQGFSQAELSRCNQQAALMQQLYQMGYDQKDCCCQTQRLIERSNYDAAIRGNQTDRLIERGFCDTNYAQATNTTAIIQNAHNDTDRVLAKLDAMEMSRKDETIAALRSQVDALNLAQSQANQNNYLVNQLRPCPIPSYPTCNPWASQAPYGSCGTYGGCSQGCGSCC